MSGLRIGSLFSGYGGLDMAVAAHYDATVAWHVEFDKHPAAVLAHHYPDVPNYGDVIAVDWAAVEPVDIITGGYPCQPFSHAGQRRGTTDERHLWPYVADCLRVLRPRVAVFENVAGHLTLGFDTVLADLAALGFDAVWGVVSAAEAGAAHRRQRLFIVATDAARKCGDRGWGAGPRRWAESPDSGGDHPRSQESDVALLPTPTTGTTPNGHGRRGGKAGNGNQSGADLDAIAKHEDFGPYTAAIARWATVIGRPAPAPTEPGQNGRPRLSPAFVEWLMGLPDGWVTGVDIPRSAQLKALGNGVVPQQAALALHLLERVA